MRDLGTEFMNAPSEMTHEDVLRVKLEGVAPGAPAISTTRSWPCRMR